jgi:hypothetical protein
MLVARRGMGRGSFSGDPAHLEKRSEVEEKMGGLCPLYFVRLLAGKCVDGDVCQD